jgi:release factor glutamine methyltransferase
MDTWLQLRRNATDRLRRAGIVEEADALADFAAAEALGESRADARLRDHDRPSPAQRRRFDGLLDRLCAGEPFAYAAGWAPFLGHRIQCDRRALIPRPETEHMVERILAAADLWALAAPAVADIGSGTGCIAIALALARPHARVWGVDISEEALSLARENAAATNADRVVFLRGDLLSVFPPATLDAIVSNPPYVSTGVWRTLDPSVRDFEPRSALDGGPDGLDLIRRLANDAPRVLKPGGRVFLEIGEDQGAEVRRILENAGFPSPRTESDFFGRTRFAEVRLAARAD